MSDIAQKKILVTGGTGHLGSALIHFLVNEKKVPPGNIRVFYLANSPTGSLNDIKGPEFFAGNVLNAADVEQAVEGVQWIFHMIGSTTFDTRQKRIQWLVNVEGTRNVLEAARNSPTFEKMCYTSTVNALGVPNPVGSMGNFENSSPYTNQPKLHSFSTREEVLAFTEQVHNSYLQNKRGGGPWQEKIGIGYYDSKLAAHELVAEYEKKYALNVVSVLPGTMFGPYDHLIGTGIYILSLYRNQMPVVLKGGLPLAHVTDVAEGHILAMEKAAAGTAYILSGMENDNRHLQDMCGIIVDVLRKKFPGKKINTPRLVIPEWIAMVAGFLSEQYAKLLNKPMLLSRDSVRPGACCSFYTSANAMRDLGYNPKRTFKQAVEEMVDYYTEHGLMETEGRWIDKRK